MNLHLIYWTFLQEVAPSKDRAESYFTRYLKPNETFLRHYFQEWAGTNVEKVIETFDELYPPDLVQNLEALFPLERTRQLCKKLFVRYASRLRFKEEVNVYVMIGVYTTNAFATFISGRPAMAICLEHFDFRSQKHKFSLGLAPETLPLWFAHELAHCARMSEDSCALIRKLLQEEGEFRWKALAGRVPLWEWLWAEGVAVAFTQHVTEAPLHLCLGFSPEKLAFCQEKEEELWQAFFIDAECTDLTAYSKWFEGLELSWAKKIPPERAGYYLGYRAVENLLGACVDERDWANLCRLGKEEILTVLHKKCFPG